MGYGIWDMGYGIWDMGYGMVLLGGVVRRGAFWYKSQGGGRRKIDGD